MMVALVSRSLFWAVILAVFLLPSVVQAQLSDITQTPNTENVGIKKSLSDQIGAGRGDVLTPGSSIFLIQRDPFRSISRGRQLFQRKFTVAQGFGPLTGDGIGDIEMDGSLGAGLVDSCAGCHSRPRGSAGVGGNVFTRPDSRDAPHLFGLGLQEMLADEITSDLRGIREQAIQEAQSGDGGDGGDDDDDDDDDDSGSPVTKVLESKGIHYGEITAFPDGSVDTSAVQGVNEDLRVRPFFAEGTTISIREFTVGALNAEMGLEAPDPDLAAASSGGIVTTPAGMVLDGTQDDIEGPPVTSEMEDADGDGVVNEIPTSLVDHMEFYLLNYFKPATYRQNIPVLLGRIKFNQMGCNSCHMPELLIEHDRRVADVQTEFDSSSGIFNRLFAEAIPIFTETDDMSGFPTLKSPAGNAFLVRNIFTDFKRHDLGPNFWERNFDGTLQKEFMTEALWGVGTTLPYGHDGRSINLREVILRHGGEAQSARDNFANANGFRQRWVMAFLDSLVLFGPPDTASNLNPGDPMNPDFPQRGHGSIKLSVLFNDPNDPE
ncbi:MAG: di-heme oxidoredictase family protein [Planctomycetota bacterium]